MSDKDFNLEVLAPAGSFDALVAAVRSGADAVYLGLKELNARAGAENFDFDSLLAAAEYCRERAVKVYLALNTIVFDHEAGKVLSQIKVACDAGVDGIIVQDLGVASLVKEAAPEMRLHASTQMSVHSPAGARLLYEMGFDRVVLARELSEEEIGEIVSSCPIECEVFVHGAHCMSVSGQCYMSSLLGQRSGNRGQCAQPCRLPFSADGTFAHDLSLKDLSLIGHLSEIRDLGVVSVKIEGRLKRPEYVAAAVRAVKSAVEFGRAPKEEMERLKAVFSRSGFTDGYFTGRRGPDMFGIRQKEDVARATEKVLASIRAEYKGENPLVPVRINFEAKMGAPAVLSISDGENSVTVKGGVPEEARSLPLDFERARAQLCKTGGTPYFVEGFECELEPGLALTAAQLNELRRRALEELARERKKARPIPCRLPALEVEKRLGDIEPRLRVRVQGIEQVSDIMKGAEIVFVPIDAGEKGIADLMDKGYPVGVEVPRAVFGIEKAIGKRLEKLRALGINDVLANNLGAVKLGLDFGFKVHGGFGLNAANSFAARFLEKLGLCDCTLSFELRLDQAKDIGGSIGKGIVAYGRLPLMLVRNCPLSRIGCAGCGGRGYLTDRMGKKFPVMCSGFGFSEVLNCVPLYLADIRDELWAFDFLMLHFTDEGKDEAAKVTRQYLEGGEPKKEGFTRGLYFRGVKDGK